MLPRTLLTALILSTVAVGAVVAAEPAAARNATPDATESTLGAGSSPTVFGLVGWLRGRPLLRGALLVGVAAVGLVLARAGYRRVRARYRSYTSPTVVLLDDDLEELGLDDAVEASDRDDAETDDRNS